MKKLAALSISALMIALVMGLIVTPASAKPYPPKKPTCQVSDTTLSPGEQVTVSGKHWKPGSTVTITLRPEGIHLGSATVGTNGRFSAVVTIPTNGVTAGPHTIECSGIDRKGNPVVLGTTITISGIVSGGGGGAAFTGSTLNVPLWTVILAGLFALGVALVMLGRRRRRRAARTGS
jgi:hypothetical protein